MGESYWEERHIMNWAFLVLLALSVATGFVLGRTFSGFALVISGAVLAMLSAAVLHTAGFGAVAGIASIAACLTVNQVAYLLALASRGLVHQPADDEPRSRSDNEIARENQRKQLAPSQFA
jgi:hypothetical protein